jgi:hypothetical protein
MSSVDVVVPCYRYGHFLRECVESVLAQSGPRVRVLIIDDASPDNTSEVAANLARSESRVTFLKHVTNKGHIAVYNEGIEWASGDYMLILSADDYLLPNALSRSANLMDAHPEVGFTFGKALMVHQGRNGTRQTHRIKKTSDWQILKGMEFLELNGASNIVPTPTAIVRTALQKRLGGYRHELPHAGDMEMWMRLAAHASVGVLAAHQAAYRCHNGNMSLAYTKQGLLPDLQQRKAALDCFFQTSRYSLPDPERLRCRLYLALARTAVGLASAAFIRAEIELSEQLAEYAVSICPEVKTSLSWVKLTCIRCVGYRTWRALRPSSAKDRRALCGE